jgi:hypothetical protein
VFGRLTQQEHVDELDAEHWISRWERHAEAEGLSLSAVGFWDQGWHWITEQRFPNTSLNAEADDGQVYGGGAVRAIGLSGRNLVRPPSVVASCRPRFLLARKRGRSCVVRGGWYERPRGLGRGLSGSPSCGGTNGISRRASPIGDWAAGRHRSTVNRTDASQNPAHGRYGRRGYER